MVQGQATNQLSPQPRPGGYAGIVFGVSVTSADVLSSPTVTGYGVVVALAEGKQVGTYTGRALTLLYIFLFDCYIIGCEIKTMCSDGRSHASCIHAHKPLSGEIEGMLVSACM